MADEILQPKEITDLQRACAALATKGPIFSKLWAYYDGLQPLRYSTDKLKEAFKAISVRFTQNWCEVIVNSALERIEFTDFLVLDDAAATQTLAQSWDANDMDLYVDDVHLCTLVTGEAFVLAWPNEDDETELFYNDSRLCHLFYQPDNPKRKQFAAKWWQDDLNDLQILVLYYPDRLEWYRSKKALKELSGPAKEADFEPFTQPEGEGQFGNVLSNPFELIPVFHFRRETRAIKSELSPSILDMQDAVNKLLADMMISAEFAAWRQRYIISDMESVGSLKSSPGEVWDLAPGDPLSQPTTVGEFSATDLHNFLQPLAEMRDSMASMSRTPAHYFQLGKREDPSGESLLAREAPLNKKCKKYIVRFRKYWREVAFFILAVEQIEVAKEQIKTIYENPATVQPLTQANTRKENRAAGLPLRTILKYEGWKPHEITDMEADQQIEASRQRQSLAAALSEQQRQFDQNGSGES